MYFKHRWSLSTKIPSSILLEIVMISFVITIYLRLLNTRHFLYIPGIPVSTESYLVPDLTRCSPILTRARWPVKTATRPKALPYKST
jgi:hypothetical protein